MRQLSKSQVNILDRSISTISREFINAADSAFLKCVEASMHNHQFHDSELMKLNFDMFDELKAEYNSQDGIGFVSFSVQHEVREKLSMACFKHRLNADEREKVINTVFGNEPEHKLSFEAKKDAMSAYFEYNKYCVDKSLGEDFKPDPSNKKFLSREIRQMLICEIFTCV